MSQTISPPSNRTRDRKHLYNALVEQDITLDAASRAIGKNQTYLQKFLHDSRPRELRGEVRYALAKKLNISPEDLMSERRFKAQKKRR